MAPLEPWEKVFVNAETFPMTDHGEIGCVECHGGEDVAEKDVAHEGVVARPSEGDAPACADCHEDQVALTGQNLHFTQEGYWTMMEGRGVDRNHEGVQMMFGNHCASCHTSCGDCHVGQPASVGGGLFDGHVFTSNPPMTRTCTACHGSRVGNEYLGKNEGVLADVHFRQERMVCIDCHEGAELHGDIVNEEGEPPNHRYDGVDGAQCQDCHLDYATSRDDVKEHRLHEDTAVLPGLPLDHLRQLQQLPCADQRGNRQPVLYDRRDVVHVPDWPQHAPERRTAPTSMCRCAMCRSIPESFAFYGDDLMPEFDNLPTWHYATPHNIQRNTPQTETCNSCHGNPDIFLTADKVNAAELGANAGAIVDEIPELQRGVKMNLKFRDSIIAIAFALMLMLGMMAACAETPAAPVEEVVEEAAAVVEEPTEAAEPTEAPTEVTAEPEPTEEPAPEPTARWWSKQTRCWLTPASRPSWPTWKGTTRSASKT